MALNVRTKEAVKTALAMTIAYGIALSMDWGRPNWAAIEYAGTAEDIRWERWRESRF
jgi:hypothetical protein